MVKKPLITIFSVLVLFSVSLFAFSGCQKTYTHEFGEWTIVKQATCEESGKKLRKYKKCDETELETFTALGYAQR